MGKKKDQIKPKFDNRGKLMELVVGTCDYCGFPIDNANQPFIEEKDKLYHVECYAMK